MNWILSALVLLLLIPAAVEECYQLVFSVPKKGEDAIFALPEAFFFGYSGAIFERLRNPFY